MLKHLRGACGRAFGVAHAVLDRDRYASELAGYFSVIDLCCTHQCVLVDDFSVGIQVAVVLIDSIEVGLCRLGCRGLLAGDRVAKFDQGGLGRVHRYAPPPSPSTLGTLKKGSSLSGAFFKASSTLRPWASLSSRKTLNWS